MPRIFPIARNQFLVTVQDLSAYFETFSGIDDSTQVSEYSDGFDNRLYPMLGPRTIAEITLTKAYEPERDDEIIALWQEFRLRRGDDVRSRGYTVTIQPIEYSPEPEPIGSPFVVYGFLPTRFMIADADKKSQDVSMLTLGGRANNWSRS
jgi:hypothetical protein